MSRKSLLSDPRQRSFAVGLLLALLTLAAVAYAVLPSSGTDAEERDEIAPAAAETTPGPEPVESSAPAPEAPRVEKAPAAELPGGVDTIFGGDRFLVAYYGTAGTGALGVLGEDPPERAFERLQQAAAPFARPGSEVMPVFELIVTVADAAPGKDGDYAHDISREAVQQYIDAAHEHGALLLLDIQPGRTSFAEAARRWGWALKDPYVGLALDPEWRMGRNGVPGQRIGSVGAAEVNRTSAWLRDLVRRNDLPQKLFVLHQFRTDMIRDIGEVKPRRGLVMVQHVDGFGTPGQKLGTYRAVARPGQFRMGFKLFYDEDVDRMSAAEVRRIRPTVRFVSFQ
jgi:hypothetical protein